MACPTMVEVFGQLFSIANDRATTNPKTGPITMAKISMDSRKNITAVVNVCSSVSMSPVNATRRC